MPQVRPRHTWAENDGVAQRTPSIDFSGELFILVNAILRRIESNG